MLKIILIITFFLPQLVLISTSPSTAFASACIIKYSPTPLVEHFPPLADKDPTTGSNIDPKSQRINFEVTVSDKSPSQKYRIVFDRGGFSTSLNDTIRKPVYVDNLTSDINSILKTTSGDLPYLQYNSSTQAGLFSVGTHAVAIERVGVENQVYCQDNYTIQPDKENGLLACDLIVKPSAPTESDEITVDGTITVNKNIKLASTAYLNLKGGSIDLQETVIFQRVRSEGLFQKRNDQIKTVNFGKLPTGEYKLIFRNASDSVFKDTNCSYNIKVAPYGQQGSVAQIGAPQKPTITQDYGQGSQSNNSCKDGNNCTKASGISCDPKTGEPGDGGILTAIGCIPTEPSTFVAAFLRFSASVGGGIALLLMIFGGFRMITSQGNPEMIKKGQDQFSSAIIGLLFVIFSVLLLQIIGVDILSLSGFTK